MNSNLQFGAASAGGRDSAMSVTFVQWTLLYSATYWEIDKAVAQKDSL